MVTTGSQKITVWGPSGTTLGINRVKLLTAGIWMCLILKQTNYKNIIMSWDVLPCRTLKTYQHFRETCYCHQQWYIPVRLLSVTSQNTATLSTSVNTNENTKYQKISSIKLKVIQFLSSVHCLVYRTVLSF
jgi:hypothetical protein